LTDVQQAVLQRFCRSHASANTCGPFGTDANSNRAAARRKNTARRDRIRVSRTPHPS